MSWTDSLLNHLKCDLCDFGVWHSRLFNENINFPMSIQVSTLSAFTLLQHVHQKKAKNNAERRAKIPVKHVMLW